MTDQIFFSQMYAKGTKKHTYRIAAGKLAESSAIDRHVVPSERQTRFPDETPARLSWWWSMPGVEKVLGKICMQMVRFPRRSEKPDEKSKLGGRGGRRVVNVTTSRGWWVFFRLLHLLRLLLLFSSFPLVSLSTVSAVSRRGRERQEPRTASSRSLRPPGGHD